MIGAKTATVVSVEPLMAPATSRAPSRAASSSESPFSRRCVIASSTTIELSTSIPMPRARPPSDIRFSVTPPKYIGAKVTSTERGIEIPMISVGPSLRSANQITAMASSAPVRAELCTSSIAERMNVD